MGNCRSQGQPSIYRGPSSTKEDSLQIQTPEVKVQKEIIKLPPKLQEVVDLRIVSAGNPLVEFTFNELKSITENFKKEYVLGVGGFGFVYRGFMTGHVKKGLQPLQVAVKVHDAVNSFQGHKEWMAEVELLGELSHPNLVKLIGFCCEGEHRVLIYELMVRGSVESHLFIRAFVPLPWAIRIKIAYDAAKGLAFLHEAKNPIIYRDFKTSNILLDQAPSHLKVLSLKRTCRLPQDMYKWLNASFQVNFKRMRRGCALGHYKDFNAKLSDFGLAKNGPVGDTTHVSTRIMGTYGYAAPEYMMTGHLTTMSDVYSYGVVLLELLTGKRSLDKSQPAGKQELVDWIVPYLTQRRSVLCIIDPRLGKDYPEKAVQRVARLAYHCISHNPKARPLMRDVVDTLEPLHVAV